jgi:ubiquinone/menaquinone biosynthesis C-methylase UbiE
MHRIHNDPRTHDGPETSGNTIHWASQYDLFTGLMGLGVNRPSSRMVVEMAHIKPGDKVLDVGCGTGNLTLTAAQIVGSSGQITGIDAAPEMIELARKKADRLHSSTLFDVGLIENLSYPDGTFDVVISRLVIHHLPDDLKLKGFAGILRVLKPGGVFFLADFMPPTNPILAHITSALVGPGMMEANVWSIPALLKQAGFMNVESGTTRSAFLAFVSGKKSSI